jgi:hypothetical protein
MMLAVVAKGPVNHRPRPLDRGGRLWRTPEGVFLGVGDSRPGGMGGGRGPNTTGFLASRVSSPPPQAAPCALLPAHRCNGLMVLPVASRTGQAFGLHIRCSRQTGDPLWRKGYSHAS